MRAHTLARVALLVIASSSWACGAQSPVQGDGRWKTAGALPPSSGLADYQSKTGSNVMPLSHPRPDGGHSDWDQKPGWDGGHGKGRDGGWGNDWGGNWGGSWGGGWDGGWGGNWCPPYSFFGAGLPYYWPPAGVVWGPFSPIPLLDAPGIPVGPVAPFFDPFGFGWGL